MKTCQSLIMAFIFLIPLAWGHEDLSLSSGIRSYPFGGSLNLETGKSFLLWGQKEEKPTPRYGYYPGRPSSFYRGNIQ